MLVEAFTPEVWNYAVQGAAGGAAIAAILAIAARWNAMAKGFRRWRAKLSTNTPEALASETDIDLPDHEDDTKPRRPLVFSIVIGAIFGAIAWAGWKADNPMLSASVGVIMAFFVLVSEIRREEPEPAPPTDLPDPFDQDERPSKAAAIGMACFTLVLALEQLPNMAEPLLETLGLSSGEYRAGLFSLVLFGLGAAWLVRTQDGPPPDLSEDGLETWGTINRVLLVCMVVIVLGFLAWFIS